MGSIGFDKRGYVPKAGRRRMEIGGNGAAPGTGAPMGADLAWTSHGPASDTLVGRFGTKMVRSHPKCLLSKQELVLEADYAAKSRKATRKTGSLRDIIGLPLISTTM